MRHSAGLLMALFVGHLGMVAGGVLCVAPGMAPMSGSISSEAARAEVSMPGMAKGHAGTKHGATVTELADGSSSDQDPCSGPASGTCAATMPCVTALGVDVPLTLASPTGPRLLVQSLTVHIPVSSGAAPEIPPPRA